MIGSSCCMTKLNSRFRVLTVEANCGQGFEFMDISVRSGQFCYLGDAGEDTLAWTL
jgi:hypothetical protein